MRWPVRVIILILQMKKLRPHRSRALTYLAAYISLCHHNFVKWLLLNHVQMAKC